MSQRSQGEGSVEGSLQCGRKGSLGCLLLPSDGNSGALIRQATGRWCLTAFFLRRIKSFLNFFSDYESEICVFL